MPTLSPIQIKPGPIGWIWVVLPYSPDRLEKIRTFAKRIWNDDHKCWAIPRTARTVDRLKAIFSADQIIIDPNVHHPQPTHLGRRPSIRVAPGSAHDAVRFFATTLRKEAYSTHTIKIYTRHAGRFLQTTQILPADIVSEHIKIYLQALKHKDHATPTYYSQAIRALKSFCKLGLHKSDAFVKEAFPPRKKPREETEN